MTAGEDIILSFYAGPPFKMQHIVKSHNNYIQSARFNPSGDTGSIMNVHWVNDVYFITCSMDKTIKVWNKETFDEIKKIDILSINKV